MTTLQKGTLWVTASIVLVFLLSAGLGWYTYGYLDAPTLWTMALMLLPILGLAALIAVWFDRDETKDAEALGKCLRNHEDSHGLPRDAQPPRTDRPCAGSKEEFYAARGIFSHRFVYSSIVDGVASLCSITGCIVDPFLQDGTDFANVRIEALRALKKHTRLCFWVMAIGCALALAGLHAAGSL